MRALGGKYPGSKRQTVNDFKLVYLELKKKQDKADDGVKEIVKKKAGHPTLLPAELMQKVVDLFSALRLKGAPVSLSVICSVARGVILANDRSLLLENGGHIDLNIDRSRQVLYRFDTIGRKISCRMATSAKISITPVLLNETKFDFQRKIKAWHEIPEALIINFDQTPLPYICSGNRTYAKKGSSNVALVGKAKKKQITGTFTITMSGSFLPMQLINKGKTNFCLPKGVNFCADFHVTCTPNCWSNESKAIQHLEKIVFPYVEKKKKELNFPLDQKAMLIFYVFKGHVTVNVTSIIEENNCVMIYVPNNFPDQFQSLDLNVNVQAKQFLKKKFECWYTQQISRRLENGTNVYDAQVPLKLSIIKPILVKWLLGLYDHLRNSSEAIIKGFEMAGIKEALEMEFPSENLFADLDS